MRGHTHGGAIHNHGTLVLSQVAISGSRVITPGDPRWGGGGLTNAGDGTATLTNVTVAANTIDQSFGAGIENGGTLKLFNVTISANRAPAGQGGGLANGVGFFTGAGPRSARLNNTIISGNVGNNCAVDAATPLTSVGHNISNDTSCTGLTAALNDQINVNPGLIPILDSGLFVYLYALGPGSPAIDRGSGPYDATTDIGCANVDQRGVARPQDGDGNGTAVCDIGASRSGIPRPTSPSPRSTRPIPSARTASCSTRSP